LFIAAFGVRAGVCAGLAYGSEPVTGQIEQGAHGPAVVGRLVHGAVR
jgi:hypothetical protein